MKREDINQLINKYMSGETTSDDENLLYECLKGENIPDEWLIVREMISDYSSKAMEYDKLLAERRRHRKYLRLEWAAAIAALIAVGIGVFVFPTHETTSGPALAEKQKPNNEIISKIDDNDSVGVNVNDIVETYKEDRLSNSENKPPRGPKKTKKKQVDVKPIEQSIEASENLVYDYSSDPLAYHDAMTFAIKNRGFAVQHEVKSMTEE